MLFLSILFVQGLGGMSSFPPPEEYLRFVFVHDDEQKDLEWKIRGSATTPTEWSGSKFFEIVEQCGGNKLRFGASLGRRISVFGRSGGEDLEIARCVKASTSVRFSVGIERRAYGNINWYTSSFRTLWNR